MEQAGDKSPACSTYSGGSLIDSSPKLLLLTALIRSLLAMLPWLTLALVTLLLLAGLMLSSLAALVVRVVAMLLLAHVG